MITVIPSGDRYHVDLGWLSTHWHFSFQDYYDPANLNWSVLRVFNDDVVQPGQGFRPHPHRDMEIIAYVLEGELEHSDNQGNTGVLPPGSLQVMSAGSGIVHTEYNRSHDKPVHLLQMWILPRTKGLPPRWEQRQFLLGERTERLFPVVSGGEVPGTLAINQDAVVHLAQLAAGAGMIHSGDPVRNAYLFVIAGAMTLNQRLLRRGDQARIAHESELHLQTAENTDLILLDLP